MALFMIKYLVILQVASITKEFSGTKEIGRVHFRRYGEPKIDNGRVTVKDPTIKPFVQFLPDLERGGVWLSRILLYLE